MCYKKILNVFTIIWKGNQKVGFKVENLEKNLFLNPSYVSQNTGVQINELEALIGSNIKPIFYKVGETMESGKVFQEGPTKIIKTFDIQLVDSLDNLKIKNSSRLESIKKIEKVFHFHRNEKEIIGFDIGEEKAIFVNENQVLPLTKLGLDEIHILEGSYISPEYYNEGENIYEGLDREPEACRKSGVILERLNLRLLGNVEEMHKNFENSKPKYAKKHDYGYDYRDSYDSNDWLADAAGTDDPEVMNDVYWNLD